jgi:hypothetical protein
MLRLLDALARWFRSPQCPQGNGAYPLCRATACTTRCLSVPARWER